MLWQTLLKGDPLPWLLEKSDPAVRALTLRQLLDRGPRDADLRETQQRAMTSSPISTILKRQKPDGSWAGPNMYGPKYQGTHWSNLLLIEYGADPNDPRVRRAARRVLDDLAEPEKNGMGWVFGQDHGVSCFVGNVVRYVALAGYGADARVEPLVQRLVRDSKKYDAACVINGDDPCAWGYARLIWGLAALPEDARTREVERTLRRGVEFLLTYKLERGRYPTTTEPSYLWRQLSFPLFYQADVLFVLRAIDAAGELDDPRAQPAIAWLLARQDPRGRWAGRAPYADRMASRVDASKWVTLQVLTLLKHAFPSGENLS
ncbi:MAG TPA: hypothetical protein VM052_00945 [Candidatus Limnocylindrales bacterium]|nr:hypothetical protein [Candidatus Limnocylindrales bacterium]